MAEFSEYPNGTFCWVELVTSDTEGAKKFYNELFGWKLTDSPAGPGMVYTMAQLGDENVGAMYQMNSEQESAGVPPRWNSYISVDSADDTAARANASGGKLITEPFDVFEAGRMFTFEDPTGATCCVWQPREHIGAQITNVPNTFCWNELATRDPDTAREFYTKVFGWGAEVMQTPTGPYTMFKVGDRMNGGMLQITQEWGDIPPNWSVYFNVDNFDDSLAKVKSLSGSELFPPMDAPGVGRFTAIQDPQGAVFSLIQADNYD